jgi:hypothetical protein
MGIDNFSVSFDLVFKRFGFLLIVLGEDFQFEVGDFVGDVFLCFEQENLLFANLIDKTFAIVLNVAFLESVAMSALGMTVSFREAEAHVAPINVMPTVGLLYRKDSAA